MSVLARENPFAASRVLKARYRLEETEWDALLERLSALRMRAAIVGRKGRGKTTLLEDLAPRLEALGWHPVLARIPPGQGELPPRLRERLGKPDPREVFLIDSAGQLSLLERRMLRARTRRAGGLVVTSHRAGLLPTLARLETTPEILEGLVREVSGRTIGDFGLTAEGLFARHRGNLRDALRELYDVCAGRAGLSAAGIRFANGGREILATRAIRSQA